MMKMFHFWCLMILMTVTEGNAQQQLSEIASELTNLQNKYAALESRLDARNTAVAFYARFSTDPSTVSGRATLIYNVVRTNIGHAYNVYTGQFTAPVPGVYVFLVNCMADSTLYEELEILLDGQRVGGCVSQRTRAQREWDLGSSFLTIHLNAGQKVWTRNWSHTPTHIRGDDWQLFSGFLIAADE